MTQGGYCLLGCDKVDNAVMQLDMTPCDLLCFQWRMRKNEPNTQRHSCLLNSTKQILLYFFVVCYVV